MKNILFIVSAFIFCSFAVANDFEELRAMTSNPERLSGTFTQSKYLSQIDISIPSSGSFYYEKDKEIIWRTLKPIDSTLKLTPKAILNYQGSEKISQLDTDSNPFVSVFSDIFFGVMTAQWQVLEEYFSVEASVNSTSWEAVLTPQDANIRSFTQKITLQGDQYLRQMTLYEADGNRTHIEFNKLQNK